MPSQPTQGQKGSTRETGCIDYTYIDYTYSNVRDFWTKTTYINCEKVASCRLRVYPGFRPVGRSRQISDTVREMNHHLGLDCCVYRQLNDCVALVQKFQMYASLRIDTSACKMNGNWMAHLGWPWVHSGSILLTVMTRLYICDCGRLYSQFQS